MAEETKDVAPESSDKKDAPLTSSFDTSVFDAYSNNSEIILGETDIAIAFLHDIGFPGAAQKPLVRIVMTHAIFLNFVSYCNTRAKLIQDGYGGKIPTLVNTEQPQEEIKESIDAMWARKKVVARFEFADDES